MIKSFLDAFEHELLLSFMIATPLLMITLTIALIIDPTIANNS